MIKAQEYRLWTRFNDKASKKEAFDFQGSFWVSSISKSLGAYNHTFTPDPSRKDKFNIQKSGRSAPSKNTITLTGCFEEKNKFIQRACSGDCSFDLQLHFGKCNDPSIFSNWNTGWLILDARVEGFTTSELALTPSNSNPVLFSISISYVEVIELCRPSFYSQNTLSSSTNIKTIVELPADCKDCLCCQNFFALSNDSDGNLIGIKTNDCFSTTTETILDTSLDNCTVVNPNALTYCLSKGDVDKFRVSVKDSNTISFTMISSNPSFISEFKTFIQDCIGSEGIIKFIFTTGIDVDGDCHVDLLTDVIQNYKEIIFLDSAAITPCPSSDFYSFDYNFSDANSDILSLVNCDVDLFSYTDALFLQDVFLNQDIFFTQDVFDSTIIVDNTFLCFDDIPLCFNMSSVDSELFCINRDNNTVIEEDLFCFECIHPDVIIDPILLPDLDQLECAITKNYLYILDNSRNNLYTFSLPDCEKVSVTTPPACEGSVSNILYSTGYSVDDVFLFSNNSAYTLNSQDIDFFGSLENDIFSEDIDLVKTYFNTIILGSNNEDTGLLFYVYKDDCWITTESNIGLGELYDLHLYSSANWIVTTSTGVYCTQDCGKTFDILSKNILNKITMYNEVVGYGINSDGIFMTYDSGITWEIVSHKINNKPVTNTLQDISCIYMCESKLMVTNNNEILIGD